MINLIKTTLINNDPLILTIIFFTIAAVISMTVALARTLLKKEKSDKIYLLTLILIATILTTTILITTYIK